MARKVIDYGYSIRRVAKMHEIAYSLLQRAIATGPGGKIKTRSEAHEKDMALTIAEEAALEEWCCYKVNVTSLGHAGVVTAEQTHCPEMGGSHSGEQE